MAVRKIIKIDESKCNGCSLCAQACHEGAIKMVDGVAKLIRDDYCDGLGNCLPVCPTGAISFEEREALDYDEAAVEENMKTNQQVAPLPCGCPGTNSKTLSPPPTASPELSVQVPPPISTQSQLGQWPVQIKLVPVNAPYFDGAKLLIAADCSAFAYGSFHQDFMRGKVTLIGCPKLDEGDYADKLTDIIKANNIKSVTVVRMEVPCCGGIENAVVRALQNSGKMIPWQVVTLSLDGKVLD